MNVPVAGSYTSALPRTAPPLRPPAANTWPVDSTAIWCRYRPVAIAPVLVQPPLAGSNTSADVRNARSQPDSEQRLRPPAAASGIKKFAALASSDVHTRGSCIEPVGVHVPLAGS